MPPKKNKKQPLGVVDANAGVGASTENQSIQKHAPGHASGSENVPAAPPPKSKKRKSAEAAAALGDASGTTVAPAAPAAKKAKVAKPKPDPLDVSGIELEGENSHAVPIYDTCDVIRRKIRAHLRKDGITQAAFLRALAAAALKDGRKIQSSSFSNFMRLKGPLAGNCNTTFYASYVFFEKLRIKQGKPKSADREVMEEVHPGGVDVTRQSDKCSYIVCAGQKVGMDKYGSIFTY